MVMDTVRNTDMDMDMGIDMVLNLTQKKQSNVQLTGL